MSVWKATVASLMLGSSVATPLALGGEGRLVAARSAFGEKSLECGPTGDRTRNAHWGYELQRMSPGGNLLQVEDRRSSTMEGVIDTSASQRFAHDPLHRLAEAEGVYGLERFTYSPTGELTLMGEWEFDEFIPPSGQPPPGVVGPQPSPTWPPTFFAGRELRRRTGGGSWSTHVRYSPAGVALGVGNLGLQHDAEQRLVSASWGTTQQVHYRYGAGRERLSMLVRGGPFGTDLDTYDLGHGIQVRLDPRDFADPARPDAVAVSLDVSGPAGLVATVTAGDLLFGQPDLTSGPPSTGPPLPQFSGTTGRGVARGIVYHHPDSLGTPTLAIDESGVVLARTLHAPFGKIRPEYSVGNNLSVRRFTGHENDESTGLTYMRARYYDPEIGRFLSPDLVTPGGGLEPSYTRPSGFRKGIRDKAWDGAVEPTTGRVRDPVTGRFMSKDEPWDMGHKPGHEFRKQQKSAAERGIDRRQFIDEYNDPDKYRP